MSRKRTKGKPDSWMPLFFGDFNADTSHLTLEQRMAYLNILWWMWRNGARAPNDDRQLAAISGLGTRKWRTARTTLIAFFSVSDKWLFQKRLSEEYEHAWKVYNKRVESGKQGGRPTSKDLFEETERDTERLPERPPERGGQQQPQPHSSPTDEASGEICSQEIDDRARGALRKICKALAAMGVDCSTEDAYLRAAIVEGFTADAIIALARTRKGAGKSPAYLVQTLRGQRADAAASAGQGPITAVTAPLDDAMAALIAQREELEREIYDARHAESVLQSIDAAERDRRIKAARRKIAEIEDQIEARQTAVT